MQQTDPTTYTDVSKEDWERFKLAAKTRGMNISGGSDDVVFDLIPVHVEYKEDAKTLNFIVHEPFWMPAGLTVGALHNLVANAMDVENVPKANENPVITHDHSVQAKNGKAVDPEIHPASVSRSNGAPHASKSVHAGHSR
jgi:hypothetical protein